MQKAMFRTFLITLMVSLFAISPLFSSLPLSADDDSVEEDDTSVTSKVEEKKKPLKEVVPDTTAIPGLIPLYRKKTNLYAEIGPSQLNTDFIIVISIAKGIGSSSLYTGQSWEFGDDILWQFKKVDDRIQVIRRNYRYTADHGTTEEKAVKIAYADSVLYSLPIIAVGPGGGDVVDITSVFLSDLPGISNRALRGYSFARDRSSWGKIKGKNDQLTDNVEIEVNATYTSGSSLNESEPLIMDPKGVSVTVHYSISKLPTSGYTPRLADERVGYFTTAVKNLNKNPDDNNFVRYINRWNLQKLEPKAEFSLPKKPIIFWLDKTIPYAYRKPIRDGILEWNKAFEEAGFYNAIEVRQQEENDNWDPEDINYNTIRWSTVNTGFSIGPSRVNPLTGEILDADVVLDVGFISNWSHEFELYSPSEMAMEFCGQTALLKSLQQSGLHPEQEALRALSEKTPFINEKLFFSQQMGVVNTFFEVMTAESEDSKESSNDVEPQKEEETDNKQDAEESDTKEKYELQRAELIRQALTWVTMHEVGHTLGLRHNFIQSTLHSLEEINTADSSAKYGYSGSVMDYLPVNLVPEGEKQGAYYPTKLGEYDYWAISYGYQPLNNSTEGDAEKLKKIASQQSKKELNYAEDYDCYYNSDPLINIFELGNNPLEYSKLRVRLFKQILPNLDGRIVHEGESYAKLQPRFSALLNDYLNAMVDATRYIGGIHLHRDFKGDENARPPFEVVSAQEQRNAMNFINEELFFKEPFQVPADLANALAPNRWLHWGVTIPTRYDTDLHKLTLSIPKYVLFELLSQERLSRMADTELRMAPGEDLFTIAEMLDSLTEAIFGEINEIQGEFSSQKPLISSCRRALQREYFGQLASMALGESYGWTTSLDSLISTLDLGGKSGTDDIASLARYQLTVILKKIDPIDSGKDDSIQIDSASKAHLIDLAVRARNVLNATVRRNY